MLKKYRHISAARIKVGNTATKC